MEDTRAKRQTENTASRRELQEAQERREKNAKLQAELAKKRCPNCGLIGCWNITGSPKAGEDGDLRVRYLQCRGCQRTEKIATES